MHPADLPLIPLLDGAPAAAQVDEVAAATMRLSFYGDRAPSGKTSPRGTSAVVAAIGNAPATARPAFIRPTSLISKDWCPPFIWPEKLPPEAHISPARSRV